MTGEAFSQIELRLIEAYLELVAKIGISNVTLQKVATQSKVAFGTVRYHFSNRPLDLQQASILHVAKSGQLYIENYLVNAQAKEKYDGLEAYVRGTFRWIGECRKYASFLVYFYYLGSTRSELVISNSEFVKRAQLRVLNLLHEGIGKGLYPRIDGPDQVAQQIHALVMGAALIAISQNDKRLSETQCEVAVNGIRAIIRGRTSLEKKK